ncbi:MAG TPA: glycoside hydrolase family 3 protein, partial [Bacteroidota bacterium]|nr:glycoside hydrolase family 3 protein [Bacteroidota bacterium]
MKLRLTLPFLLAVILYGCSHNVSQQQEQIVHTQSKTEWVESTLVHLTLPQRVAQMIMPSAFGYFYSDKSDDFKKLQRYIQMDKFGGVIFFQGDVYETAVLANRLQSMSDLPLLCSSDFEWGAAMRIRRSTRFPEAMALGASRDTVLAYQMGKAVAAEARAIGIEQVYAPVADVNVNPDNPVINTRSFGENPQLVADLASAYAMGLQDGGVIATAKHFPGHGDTKVDSHLELPKIDVSRSRLDSVELTPFRKLIASGIGSIMVAHLVVPALEPFDTTMPATLSSAIITGTLNNALGFRGIVVTDAMTMGAVVNRFGADSAAVRAVLAGADIILTPPDPESADSAIVHAVRSGLINQSRIDASVRKLLGVKWDLGLIKQRLVDLDNVANVVESPEHLLLAKQIAREAITVVKNDSLLPLKRYGSEKVAVVLVTDMDQYRTEINRPTNQWPNEPVGDYFMMQFRRRYSNIQVFRIDPTTNTMAFG